MIETLSDLLSNRLMFILWTIPLLINMYAWWQSKSLRFLLISLVAFPFLVYFGWAMTSFWSTHEIAKIFNRSAQISAILLVVILSIGCYEHRRS